MLLYKLFKDIVTELDGETFDVVRIMWLLGVLIFFGLSCAAMWKGQPWSPSEYGVGFGAVLAGGGAALKLKPSLPLSQTNDEKRQQP